MVGELAAGAGSRWAGGRYRHRIALGAKRTGRRGGVGKEGSNVACTYLFWLLAGPNEGARGRGEARGRRRLRVGGRDGMGVCEVSE